jgi:hypothetical protein
MSSTLLLMFWSASERPAAVMPWWDTLFEDDIFVLFGLKWDIVELVLDDSDEDLRDARLRMGLFMYTLLHAQTPTRSYMTGSTHMTSSLLSVILSKARILGIGQEHSSIPTAQ